MPPATLDRSRSFGQVYGPGKVRYEQDYKGFDGAGLQIEGPGMDDGTTSVPAGSLKDFGADYETMKMPALRRELKRRTGSGGRPGTTKPQVIERLRALDAAEEPGLRDDVATG